MRGRTLAAWAIALSMLGIGAATIVITALDDTSARSPILAAGWSDVSGAIRPPAMAGAMMAYSSKDHRFVLFGGWDGARGLNDTWVFDPTNRTWTSIRPLTSPAPRGDEMFVYDDRDDVFILFGGWYESPNATYTRLSDTWTFSLSTQTWSEGHPINKPSPRSDVQVAFSSAAGAVLLVGGFSGTGYLGDVWAYSPANDTWTPRPSELRPSPRADGRMVYVPSQDRFVLFGGNDYNGPNFTFHHLSDTWSYDWRSNIWTDLSSGIGPQARDYPLFAVDNEANTVLLTSGYGNRTILNDLWGFRLATNRWDELTPALSPPPRFAAAGGFDPTNNILVLFSGAGNSGLLADTWVFQIAAPETSSGVSPLLILIVAPASVVLVAVGSWLFKRRRRL